MIAVLNDAQRAQLLGRIFGIAVGLAFALWLLPIVISKSGKRHYGKFLSVAQLRMLLIAVMLVGLIAASLLFLWSENNIGRHDQYLSQWNEYAFVMPVLIAISRFRAVFPANEDQPIDRS